MSLCALCGSQPNDGTALCGHHTHSEPDEFPVNNRIMCDFIHRKARLERLPPEHRWDDVVPSEEA